VLMEAMSVGLPTIAADWGGHQNMYWRTWEYSSPLTRVNSSLTG
jgi:hypothetical protein